MRFLRRFRRGELRLTLAGTQDPYLNRKSFVGVVSYLIGAAAAWFSVHVAFVLYMLTPLFFIVPPASLAEKAGAASSEA